MKNTTENTANRSAVRTALRREKIAAREALPPLEHARHSAPVAAHLALLLARLAPRVLGFCWPFRGEFDCRPLVARLLADGVRACLPLVVEPDAAMAFREWRPDCAMAIDRHGIHYPVAGMALTPDVLLMPVNAFDARGFRLGYGGGYFDRTLAALNPPPLAIGVGFELARVATTHPGVHDIALDAVVTEAGLERFSARLGDPGRDPGAQRSS